MEEPRGRERAAAPGTVVWRHLGALLNKAAMAVRKRGNDALAPLGIDIRQFVVLTFLSAAGPLSQQELGERVDIDRTTMVALIDDLEQKGLVERRRNPEDRRAYAVELTPRGRQLQKRAARVLERADNEFMAPLSENEREQLRALLIRLIA